MVIVILNDKTLAPARLKTVLIQSFLKYGWIEGIALPYSMMTPDPLSTSCQQFAFRSLTISWLQHKEGKDVIAKSFSPQEFCKKYFLHLIALGNRTC